MTNRMGPSAWRGGASIGRLYRIASEHDLSRVGLCWMNGRLRVGDTIMCLKHSGDCFYDYMLVERFGNGWKGIPQSRFGSYTLGEPVDETLTDREFHLLAAGEFVQRQEWLAAIGLG